MKSFLRNLAVVAALFLPMSSAFAYDIPESRIQEGLDRKLPLIRPVPGGGDITLQPGATIRLHGNGDITLEGNFRLVVPLSKTVLSGSLKAVTDIVYENSAIYLRRIAIDEESFRVSAETKNRKTWLGKVVQQRADKAVLDFLNNPGKARDIVTTLLLKQLESRPVYRLDGSRSWHAIVTPFITDENLKVEEGRLVIGILP